MRTRWTAAVWGIPAIVLFSSCSLWERLQDSKVGKWVENLTAHYNIYFNAHEKWLQARRQMEAAVMPQARKPHPLLIVPDSARTAPLHQTMNEVIQKTQRIIKDKSRSRWVDEAYVLMGVAYLYRADPLTALQMLQYVQNHYKNEPSAVAAHLWMVMTYLQMGQVEKAAAYLDLLKERKVPRAHRLFYWKLKAQTALARGDDEAALPWIRKVAKAERRRADRLRALYVLGEVLQRTGRCREAIPVFRNLIRRYPPYDYIFHAKMNILRCRAAGGRFDEVERALLRMTRDERNKDFLDEIYFELGMLAMQHGDPAKMQHYLAEAARHSRNGNIRAAAYRHIAVHYYRQDSFEAAALYYDSAYAAMTPTFEYYDEVRLRRPVLKELVQYLEIIRTEDSLLALASLPPEKLLQRIRRQIQAQREARKRLEKKKRATPPPDDMPLTSPTDRIRYLDKLRSQQQRQGGKWYFYNPLARGVGYNDFIRQWVGVKDGDFWAVRAVYNPPATSEAAAPSVGDTARTDTAALPSASPAVELPSDFQNATAEEKAMLLQLPLDSASRAASHHRIADALLKSAILYLETLQSPRRAADQLDALLERYPASPLVPAALYYLVRAYERLGDSSAASRYRQRLYAEFPDNVYTRLLDRSLRQDVQRARRAAEQAYERLRQAYRRGRCDSVTALAPRLDTQYLDANARAGLDLMTTVCHHRSAPPDTLVARLEAFVRAHQGTDAVVMAERLIRTYRQRQIQQMREQQDSARKARIQKEYPYEIGFRGPFFYVLVLPSDAMPSSEAAQHLSNVHLIMYGGEKSFRITPIALSEDTTILLVKPFFTHAEADDYYQKIRTQTRFFQKLKLNRPIHFYITQPNFKVLLKTNKVSEYFEFFRKTYLEKETATPESP